jgi:hypothetical protein
MIPPFGFARYDPLKIYVNYEGLVRFATELYSESVETLQSRTEDLDNCNSKHRRSKQIVLPTRYLFLLCAWRFHQVIKHVTINLSTTNQRYPSETTYPESNLAIENDSFTDVL